MSVGELEVFKVAIMYKDYKEYILRYNRVNKWLYKQVNNRRDKTNHANRKTPYVGKPLLPLISSPRRWSLIFSLSPVLNSLSSKEEIKNGRKSNFTVENLANTMLSKWWWFTSPVIPCGHYVFCYDVVRIHLWYSLPNPRTPVWSREKTSAKFRLRKTPQNVRPIFLKTFKIMKNMEGMRNCHRAEKTEETWRRLNTMRYTGLGPVYWEQEKVTNGNTSEI